MLSADLRSTQRSVRIPRDLNNLSRQRSDIVDGQHFHRQGGIQNLPEAPIIADLIAASADRVQEMMDTAERPAKPAPGNAYLHSLHRMNAAESESTDTPNPP